MPALAGKAAGKTAGPVHMTSSRELVQSKSSAQRLSKAKKLLTVKIQSPRKGKAETNRRVGISKKVMNRASLGGASNQPKMLINWLTKGNGVRNIGT